jgi:SAM-dependent methyltransferase
MDFIEPKPFGKFFKKSLLSFVNHSSTRKYKRYPNKNLSFCEVLGNGSFEIYLKHRFSSQTFWSLYPFIPLLRRKRKRILDVCCGAGHASFVISKYVNPDELICVDGEFKSLYLAKKYFSGAEFINIDANYQLPFKDNIFSSILMMDAFHYVDARALLAKEFERVLDKEGMLLLLHLHNALVENVAAGKPLSPSTWRGLFDLTVKALPEKSIIEDFILRGRLDLSKRYSEKELNSSDAIIMIGGVDSDCFDGIWEDTLEIKENLIINPIYKMKEEGDKILLEREFPSEFFRREYPLTEKYLPKKCEINKKFVKGRSVRVSGSDEIEIEDLMRKFVVINVPEKYMKV